MLAASGLIQCLAQHGIVTVSGSYKYHLMTVPDIDIYITDPRAGRDQGKSIVCDLIDQGFWREFALEDWVQFQHPGFPSGIYIGLKRTFRDRLWKVNIWNVVDIPPDALRIDKAVSGISEDQRTAIVRIKLWRDSNAGKVPSKSIYDAVLEGKANDVESFRRVIGWG